MAIPTPEEFRALIVGNHERGTESVFSMRKGRVVSLYPNGEPRIQFFGEPAPRGAIFTRLSPDISVGDTVFLLQALGGFLYWKDYTVNYDTGGA